ncbi:AraC family transcriptional regulator [Micromonospora craniellae]|uniref:AraC family transcriptional regulator n=1 Tax=Micromonospora craniellae TaxID=2294034 RepID=A0A372FS29_9ACTN|nr:AraC family transcriptional regulator [Micromonospora craniellae]QOC94759.1 helix-turn-helix transcriptional regulator [Micromonospora craniellae]RFS43551.1 AraC family transcriptional regulator [Micromonospora craniellae]
MSQRTYGDDAIVPWRIWMPAVSVPVQQEDRLHVLLWQVHGDADLVVGGVQHALVAGHALWVPVGVRHEFTVRANSVTMPLFFEAADIATTLSGPTLVTVDRDLQTLMLAYTVSWNTIIEPAPNLARQILALIEESPVLSTVLPMPASEPARTIAETLRFNPGDIRGVERLAESVHASARTVERLFQAETGMTLRQWRIRNRMEAAAILLRSNAAPDAVAHRVGYTNVNAFRRVFKGHFGISPTEYVDRFKAQR